MCECYNNVRNVICFVILNESFYVVGTMSGEKKSTLFTQIIGKQLLILEEFDHISLRRRVVFLAVIKFKSLKGFN